MSFKKKFSMTASMLSILLPTLTYAAESVTPVDLSQEASILDVTVPVGFPISVNNKGLVTVANNLEILNNSYGPIRINSAKVIPKDGWTISDFEKDYSTSVVGAKEFGFKLDNAELSTSGSIPIGNKVIKGGGSLSISYDSTISPQKDSIVNSNIADVVMTIGWNELESLETKDGSWLSDVNFDKYVMAEDSDFVKNNEWGYSYVGDDEYVIVPTHINGERVTNLEYMFTREEGVTSKEGEALKPINVKGILLQDGVTNVNYAFTGLTTLEEVAYLPNTINTAYSMFKGCTSLRVVPEDLPKALNDLDYMFYNCTSLEKAPYLHDNVSLMYKTFTNSGIYSANIPPNVDSLEECFKGCKNLQGELTLPRYIDGWDILNFLEGTVNTIVLKYHPDSVAIGSSVWDSIPSNVIKQEIS